MFLKSFEKPSKFYEAFGQWLRDTGELSEAIKAEKWYELVWRFMNRAVEENLNESTSLNGKTELKLCLLLDYMSSLGKTPPQWLQDSLCVEVKEDVFELAKSNDLVDKIPHLQDFSPKERVKRIRFAGIDKLTTNLLISSLSEQVVISETIKIDAGIILVDINYKHPVSEQHPIYIYV